KLKYGCNPHQGEAGLSTKGELPIKVLNGNPGYINFMDALNSWQLVKELKQATKIPSAASFKHVSPAGAAIGRPLTDEMKKAYFVGNIEMTPLANAYARARGADRMSSFGDWAALSDEVDEATALLLKKEVSDGVVAPCYSDKALEILKNKKGGKYNIVQIDPDYVSSGIEKKDIFGITFSQQINDSIPSIEKLGEIVTKNKELPESVKQDLIVAMITLKYTQSNSVCFVYDGQVIGCGAGQQSRIHCTRLAGEKADIWWLRQNPSVLGLKFKKGIKRPERDNAVDMYLQEDLSKEERVYWEQFFEKVPVQLTKNEKKEWLAKLTGVVFGSDAFFPFRDNIDRAYRSGAGYIVQPGGSVRDDIVIEACDEYDIVMVNTGTRLFHH
ncbi:MAG: phosphoribosylaminoimidazolecarboxamide formyltransferase, partial [Clostridiales bacterium]|nr:phosphoribosylaminoimidazolecarboxamide formyltransferase [Clostridiales bacterium]